MAISVGGKFLEEGNHLATTEFNPQYRPVCLVNAVQREHRLGRVDAMLLYWVMDGSSLG
jgi:hypothetical protein